MRVAIFHDFLIEKGGGERVVNTLAKSFNAEIITSFYKRKSTYENFKNTRIIYNSGIINEKISNLSPIKILRTIFFFKNQLSKFSKFFNSHFDISIFSGFYSIYLTKSINIPKIYYIQAEPLQYVFEREAYTTNRFLFHRIFYRLFLKNMEKENINSMDKIIANSSYTKKIYEEYFKIRVSNVIYPPVNIKNFYFKNHSDFYLCVSRLYPHKRVNLIAKVFTRLRNEKLVIVGSGPLSEYITKLARKYRNIIYLGSVSDSKLRELYATCKAVIYLSEKEPFGIVPIEANASGKAAIVSNEGGLPETIINNKTGVTVDPPYEYNLERVILDFDVSKFNPKVCINNAKKFSEEVFIKRIKKEMYSLL